MSLNMTASARELRHMVGRYLYACNLPGYTVNAVRDVILAAQAEGYDAVNDMEKRRGLFASAPTTFSVSGGRFDGQDAPLVVLAPALFDELALALAASGEERATVTVVNVLDPDIIDCLHDHAAVRGLGYDVQHGADGALSITVWRVTVPPRSPASGAWGPSMERALLSGYELPSEQFWRLFHESNLALTPDSEVSRQHAGTQVRNERGEVIGELDEEAYTYIRAAATSDEQVSV